MDRTHAYTFRFCFRFDGVSGGLVRYERDIDIDWVTGTGKTTILLWCWGQLNKRLVLAGGEPHELRFVGFGGGAGRRGVAEWK